MAERANYDLLSFSSCWWKITTLQSRVRKKKWKILLYMGGTIETKSS
jgi:hypothetical protein